MLRFALIGSPLGHSMSPQLHKLISDATGIPCEYSLCPLKADEVKPFINGIAESGLHGINVTIPYKVDAFNAVDKLTDEARAIGAVNTISLLNGRTVGYNTDFYGFGAMLSSAGIDPCGKRATVLGTGGAARAAVAWLIGQGADVTVVSRRGEELPGTVKADYNAIDGGYLLVNATPVGMHPNDSGCPVDKQIVAHFEAVADLIYNPKQTRLLTIAEELRRIRADGLYMLVAQAVRAREIWQEVKLGSSIERAVYEEMCRGGSAGE